MCVYAYYSPKERENNHVSPLITQHRKLTFVPVTYECVVLKKKDYSRSFNSQLQIAHI